MTRSLDYRHVPIPHLLLYLSMYVLLRTYDYAYISYMYIHTYVEYYVHTYACTYVQCICTVYTDFEGHCSTITMWLHYIVWCMYISDIGQSASYICVHVPRGGILLCVMGCTLYLPYFHTTYV